MTGVFASIDPALLRRPTPFLGSVLTNASSGGEAPLAPFTPVSPAVKCVKGSGDAGSQACDITINPAAVARNCLFNPCANGLCDGQHRLVLRTDSFVTQTNPM